MTRMGTPPRPRPLSEGTRRPPRRYAAGRRCATDGCDVRLATYNPADHCYVHAPRIRRRARGRKDDTT